MSVRKEYRVNRCDLFVIDYVKTSKGFYEIYARRHPPDRFQRGVTHHHLYSNGQVCVTAGREPRTLEAAQYIARHWMESYSTYTRTGTFQ